MSQPPDFGEHFGDEPFGDGRRPAHAGWGEWPPRGSTAGFEWPLPFSAGWTDEPPRRRSRAASTVRVTAASLVAIAFVLAGMAAGVAVTSHASFTTNQTALQLPRGPAGVRDRGIVDVDTVLGYQQSRAAGTGIVLNRNGDVLTNNHVIAGATSVQVTDVLTGHTYRAEVLGTDPSADVAVLHLFGATGLVTATFGTSKTLQVGQAVTAIGNAGGIGGLPAVSRGFVTALHQQITAGTSNGNGALTEQLSNMVQTTATLVPGDSGGPLIDAHNHVVGMDTAAGGASVNAATENFAIPIDKALAIARLIEAGHASATVHVGPTAFLGVEIDPQSSGGAMVEAVLPGTPASGTALANNDLIVSVGGTAVESGRALSSVLAGLHVGQSVRVVWTTPDGATESATVVLVSGPSA